MSKFYQTTARKASLVVFFVLLFFTFRSAEARVPNDPEYGKQSFVWNQINAPTAWDYSIGSKNVVVALIDAGSDTWHEDLEKNIWTNSGEIPDNGIDDDLNGYIDDIHGWNFVEGTNDVRTSVFDKDSDPEAVRHGTLVAGLVGARGDNNLDGTGLNWYISLMPLRAINSLGSGAFSDVVRAVDYAVANGAAVISMSFVGTNSSEDLRQSLLRAYQKGVVVVAAAGNHYAEDTGDLDVVSTYPACYTRNTVTNSTTPWMLTVASVGGQDQLSTFSDYGSCVSLMAPGENIFSTERFAPQFGYRNTFGGRWRGTSFAAPFVAGAAALIKSVHPRWGAQEIIPLLLQTADPVDANNPEYHGKLGAGRLNVGNALVAAARLDPNVPVVGTLYSHDLHEVWRFSLADQSALSFVRLPDAFIQAVAPYSSADAQSGGAVILIRRGPYYYAQWRKVNGEFDRESPVALKSTKNNVIKQLRVLTGLNGQRTIIVEQFNQKINQTTLTEFAANGKSAATKVFTGAFVAWQTTQHSRAVVLAQLKNKKLTLQQLVWGSGRKNIFTKDAVLAVDALTVGHFWKGLDEQAALLVKTAAGEQQVLVDLSSNTVRVDFLSPAAFLGPWKLATVQPVGSDLDALFPYQVGGGSFFVVNGRGAVISSVQLPKINGTVD